MSSKKPRRKTSSGHKVSIVTEATLAPINGLTCFLNARNQTFNINHGREPHNFIDKFSPRYCIIPQII